MSDALVALGTSAAPYLRDLLKPPREGLPVEPIADSLGRLGHARALLFGLAERLDATEQPAGRQGLYAIPRPEDGGVALEPLSGGRSSAVRKQAGLLLGVIKDKAATWTLIETLSDVDRGLVSRARMALKEITELRFNADPAVWNRSWEREGRREDR